MSDNLISSCDKATSSPPPPFHITENGVQISFRGEMSGFWFSSYIAPKPKIPSRTAFPLTWEEKGAWKNSIELSSDRNGSIGHPPLVPERIEGGSLQGPVRQEARGSKTKEISMTNFGVKVLSEGSFETTPVDKSSKSLDIFPVLFETHEAWTRFKRSLPRGSDDRLPSASVSWVHVSSQPSPSPPPHWLSGLIANTKVV